jgi:PPK2 family polyphosphate:nucleotide phosphotransferase
MADDVIGRLLVRPGTTFRYAERDPKEDFGWEKDAAKDELTSVLADVDVLQARLAAEGKRALLVVLQAVDAAGKDGVIRDVFGPLNSAGVRVNGFKAPAGKELEHDYLWRVHAVTPGRGEIAIWNRSHYEDVLVVRVRNLVPPNRWRRRYAHIRHFEELLVDEGTTIVKFNLHVSNEEQRERLQARIDDPEKRWKFRMNDLEDRKLWGDFAKAYEVAMSETSTAQAPWYVIPADRKWVRNLAIAKVVRETLRAMKPKLPPDDPSIYGVKVV